MEAKVDGLELEVECKDCSGCGGYGSRHYGGFVRCRVCNGAGSIPTELGKKILELVRHNFKPMLEDAQDD